MINPAPESRSNMKINFMAVPCLDGNCLKVKSESSTAVLSLGPLGQIAAAVQVPDRWIFYFVFFWAEMLVENFQSKLGSVCLPRPSKNQYQYGDENNRDPPSKGIKTGIILCQE